MNSQQRTTEWHRRAERDADQLAPQQLRSLAVAALAAGYARRATLSHLEYRRRTFALLHGMAPTLANQLWRILEMTDLYHQEVTQCPPPRPAV